MHVLYVAQTFHPVIGGAERYIDELATAMAARGHEIHVLAPHIRGRREGGRGPVGRSYRVHRISFMEGWKIGPLYHARALPLGLRVLDLARRLGADIVHLQYPNPLALSSRLIRSGGGRVVTTVHGSEVHFLADDRLGRLTFRVMDRDLDAVIAVSDYTRDRLVENGVRPGRIHVVYNGTDPGRFRPAAEKRWERIFTACRMVPRKDIPTLLRAMAIVRETAEADLVIAGDGPERTRFERMAHDLGLGGCVRFLGVLDENELIRHHAEAGLFVLPAVYDPVGGDVEGFGIAFLEAMASRTPVIGGDVGGVPSAVRPEWGMLYRPGDHRDLAGKMLRVLLDRDLAREMGARGRAAVLDTYNWDRVAERIESLYREILEGDRHRRERAVL